MAESATPNPNPGRRPPLQEQLAGIEIAGWPGKFGGWSFKISDRSYQVSDNNWQQTPYFRTSDLIILAKLIDRMIERALSTPAPTPAANQDTNGDPPPI